jgi:hypothetical protein
MTLLGCYGIELVCTFLRVSHLAAFGAPSFGAQYRLHLRLQPQVATFGQAERTRLGAAMPRIGVGPSVSLEGLKPDDTIEFDFTVDWSRYPPSVVETLRALPADASLALQAPR